jgi:hypothetical protein
MSNFNRIVERCVVYVEKVMTRLYIRFVWLIIKMASKNYAQISDVEFNQNVINGYYVCERTHLWSYVKQYGWKFEFSEIC